MISSVFASALVSGAAAASEPNAAFFDAEQVQPNLFAGYPETFYTYQMSNPQCQYGLPQRAKMSVQKKAASRPKQGQYLSVLNELSAGEKFVLVALQRRINRYIFTPSATSFRFEIG